MSRPNITDEIVDGLSFARACVLDQRVASHNRGDHSWDKSYSEALSAIETITRAHLKATKVTKPSTKLRSKR